MTMSCICTVCEKQVAQFIAVCSAETLAEKLHESSPFSSSSRGKRRPHQGLHVYTYRGKWRTKYPVNAQAVPSPYGEGILAKWDQTRMNVCACHRNGNRCSRICMENDLRCCAG